MAEVTNDLLYEVSKRLQSDMSDLKLGQQEIRVEIGALRGHMNAVQQDVANLYAQSARLEVRLDRIERRLEFAVSTAA